MVRSLLDEWLRLRALLERYDDLYYNHQLPEISDEAYDILKRRFDWLSLRVGQASKKVGHAIDTNLPTIRHSSRMLSIDSANQDPQKFADRVIKACGGFQVLVAQPKIDGVALSLRYCGGTLVYGATRGDGTLGEDVSINARRITNIPQHVGHLADFEVRGEVYIPKEAFQLDGGNFSTARNAASGILRKLNPQDSELGMLRYVAYDTTLPHPTHSSSLRALTALGFDVVPSDLLYSREAALDHYSAYDRNAHPYALDGIVYKIEDRTSCARMGSTARSPRWAFACKFTPREGITVVRGVEFQVGRSGLITPVLYVDPVEIDGVSIGRASMHNSRIFNNNPPRINDQVIITRAGDVIPYVLKIFSELRTEGAVPIPFPTHCPSCNSELVPETCFCRCRNGWHCPAQSIARLVHYTQSIGIEQLGTALVSEFYNLQLIKTIPDLYTLTSEQVLAIPGWGVRSWSRITAQLTAPVPLDRMIAALGIDGVGTSSSQALALACGTWDRFCAVTTDHLLKIPGIGPQTAGNIAQFLDTERHLLEAMTQYVHVLPATRPTNLPLANQKWVITGTLPISRHQATALLVKYGATVTNSLAQNTHALLCGDKPGSKLDRARILGVQTYTPEEFFALIASLDDSSRYDTSNTVEGAQ